MNASAGIGELAAASQQNKAALAAAGAIPALVRQLGKDSRKAAQQNVVIALVHLADGNADNQAAIEAAGGVPALLQLLASQDDELPGRAKAVLQMLRVCAAEGCGKTVHLRRCGGCGAVRYCSEACRNAHWPAHKQGCRRLQAMAAAAAAAGGSSSCDSGGS